MYHKIYLTFVSFCVAFSVIAMLVSDKNGSTISFMICGAVVAITAFVVRHIFKHH
ncbi:hypothetical protein L0B53_14580 [Vibrio sp. SS-MA-C1-2]|uniref:hypothetical protein n=1 Tax=Vibrio sp. SS-MA-C1-2 TaxID=2908646 RepID=UPI001F48F359|nr:hypothetical protein [Vibrio sp. SS-MA-C1-2]UJF18234.1 hypothetical protein L0B53_14580 [Vibrio sp. SS-MA-C1-2]